MTDGQEHKAEAESEQLVKHNLGYSITPRAEEFMPEWFQKPRELAQASRAEFGSR